MVASASSSGARTPANDGPLGFAFHSVCLQVKDPGRSLSFYRDVLGMRIVKVSESQGFSMIFLGFPEASRRGFDDDEVQFSSARGMIQLVHVHGTDEDPSFRIEASGFCHLSLSVPDIDAALSRMSRFGVRILERGSSGSPGEAGRGGYAAIADPDGYSIQLLSQDRAKEEDLRRKLEDLVGRARGMASPQAIASPPPGREAVQ